MPSSIQLALLDLGNFAGSPPVNSLVVNIGSSLRVSLTRLFLLYEVSYLSKHFARFARLLQSGINLSQQWPGVYAYILEVAALREVFVARVKIRRITVLFDLLDSFKAFTEHRRKRFQAELTLEIEPRHAIFKWRK